MLAGWVSGVESLKAFGGPITMKANMAVGLIACGASLLLLSRGPQTPSAIVDALAIVAGTLGGVTLVEHLTGWNAGIDQLLFTEPAGPPPRSVRVESVRTDR